MEELKIEELENWYILQYKGMNLYKTENPIKWEIVKEISQVYVTKEFAYSAIKSLKRYIKKEFNGSFEEWEKSSF